MSEPLMKSAFKKMGTEEGFYLVDQQNCQEGCYKSC